MGKLLYITANTKPEDMSSSKTIGRLLVNSIMLKYPDMVLQEVDLYKDHIPQLKHSYYQGRSSIISSDRRNKLPSEEQKEIKQVIQLCNQFVKADIYVMAAPMWSLSYPAPVKEYIDCVVQGEKSIEFKNGRPYGLLNDKDRLFIYVQSSGGKIPMLAKSVLNKGLNYVRDIMKFVGIRSFKEVLVDGTGTTDEERLQAIDRAKIKVDKLVNSM